MKKKIPVLIAVLLIATLIVGCFATEESDGATTVGETSSIDYDRIFPQHEPYGEGVGAKPGRVVWSHNPDSVDWDGTGYWWDTDNFDRKTIQTMVDNSIAKLAGRTTAKRGWKTLFTSYNKTKGKTGGYKKGQKIVIKANINGSGVNSDDSSGRTQMSYTNPVLLTALLTSIVKDGGVKASDITVYDVSRIFPDYMVKMCNKGILKGVKFVGRNNGVANKKAAIKWSQSFSGDYVKNYLPTCVTRATYVINLANLKGHSYGITLCGKNNFGSFINSDSMRPPQNAGLHQFLTASEMNRYTALVDLMANYRLGAKTMLYMLDAIICAHSEGASITGVNSKWQMTPFNGDYTSSIFVSQDPVAIDSVGADFLTSEPTIIQNNSAASDPTVENYIHEAALVANAPSGATYYNGNNRKVSNLGVHEHWNNSVDKQYSRNLGKAEGIQLIYMGAKKPVVSQPSKDESSNILVAYYSRSGNTKKIADMIHAQVGGDTFRIRTVKDYPESYDEMLDVATTERNQNARPKLTGRVENMESYDVIFVGYPIWWGDTPMAILTFLESYNLEGKTID